MWADPPNSQRTLSRRTLDWISFQDMMLIESAFFKMFRYGKILIFDSLVHMMLLMSKNFNVQILKNISNSRLLGPHAKIVSVMIKLKTARFLRSG